MKKRLTSVLLTICLVASLFSAMGITAHAEMKTVEYTLKAGDTVYKVCQKLGIDFYANYDWITSTNKIKNYSALGVGKKIVLPLGEVADTTPTTPPTTTVTTPAKANVNLLTGDTIASYLIPYTVSSGDTLYDICLAKGISYNDSQREYIMKVNGLKNANRIAVGRTLLLPASSMPASGSCVAVVAHKVVSGDATYNICKSYNIDYNDNVELMKALNGKSNMAVIKTGQTLLVPVPTSITPETTVTTPSGGNTGNTGNSGSTDNKEEDKKEEEQKPEATPTPVSYNITKKNVSNTQHGSYTVRVNNSSSSDKAQKGDSVVIYVEPKNERYILDYIKVLDKNNKAVSVTKLDVGHEFTMPESDVTIEVAFASADYYTLTAKDVTSGGSYYIKVNGEKLAGHKTFKVYEGQTVEIIAEPDYNYEVSYVKCYSDVTSASMWPWMPAPAPAEESVVNKKFEMPANDVTVEVGFQKAQPHNIYPAASFTDGSYKTDNGSFNVLYEGMDVSKAMAGQRIDITTKAADGYELKEIKVEPYNNTTEIKDTVVFVDSDTFVMPAFNVKVTVTFKAEVMDIKPTATTNGTFTVVDGNGKAVDFADTAAGIYVKPTPDAGYVVDKVSYTDYSGKVVEVGKTGDHYYFAMPASDITVNVTFKARVFYLSAHADSPAATFSVNGKTVTSAYMGETVTVNGNPAEGVKVKEIKAYNTSKVEIPMTTSNTLVMPAGNVNFKVIYELDDIAINKESASNGSFSFKKTDANGDAITTAHMGDKVYVATAPNNGYYTSKIVVTYADGKTEDITGSQTFTMPSKAVSVAVTFTGNSNKLAIVNSTPSLGTTHLELKGTAGEIGSARTGETVKIVNSPVSGYKVGTVTAVDAKGNSVTVKDSSFVMPASDVTVSVTYIKK